MGTFITENGYFGYISSNYQMNGNHGFHAAEHKADMEQIASDICD